MSAIPRLRPRFGVQQNLVMCQHAKLARSRSSPLPTKEIRGTRLVRLF
jgi:hypothetical protein